MSANLTTTESPLARVPATQADWNAAGLAFRAKGELDKALHCYQNAMKSGPEAAGVWSNTGNTLSEMKRYPNAIIAHRRALALEPENEMFRKNMLAALGQAAVELKAEKKFQESLGCYREALKWAPKNAAIWASIGNLLAEMAREALPKLPDGKYDFAPFTKDHDAWKLFDSAVRALRVAVKLDPEQKAFQRYLAVVLNTIGVGLRTKKHWRASLSNCQEAVRLAPDLASAWSNLGNVQKDMKFIRSAIASHKRAVELSPDSSDCLFNLAVAYAAGMRSEEALAVIAQALEKKPNDPDLRWDRALNCLRLGQYEQGFADYEARLETGALPERNPPGKMWNGKSYKGKTLLVVSEQGYGDTIWASRYLARVKALGGTLIVECRPAMVPLIESLGVADKIIAKNSQFSAADLHINICSLPGLFVKKPEDVSGVPYITAPADRGAKARAAVGDAGGRKKVGIVWSGSTTFKGNADRAVPLRMFLDAFALPGVQLYSLQKGPPAAELRAVPHAPVIDLGPHMEDFADAAAMVAEMDMIIMTDSAVAHLAGAMGKPVWMLLNYAPYWMWGMQGERVGWYDSVRVVRQQVWGDWVGVFDGCPLLLRNKF